MAETDRDERYLRLILDPLETSKNYQPQFGKGEAVSLSRFRAIYQADPFYSWFGLDDPLIYAAHKAAGGITSIYRQIGIGCEALFRQLLMDELGLTNDQVNWSYVVEAGSRSRTLHLDARIPLEEVGDLRKRAALRNWLDDAGRVLDADPDILQAIKGIVFEVRQGYKSKDSKRQNADIANAASAYRYAYLPVIALLSLQMDDDLARRYQESGLLLLHGSLAGSSTASTYAFCRELIGYDLAAFFERNTAVLQGKINEIVQTLLSA